MIKEKLNIIRIQIKEITKQKSITLSGDGIIQITCRYKPDEITVNDKLKIDKYSNYLKKKIELLLNIEYRLVMLQKKPDLCYNTYVRLSNHSSEATKHAKNLKYFTKDKKLSSYSEIIFKFKPKNNIKKQEFINLIDSIIDMETLK